MTALTSKAGRAAGMPFLSRRGGYLYSLPFTFTAVMTNLHLILGLVYRPNLLYTALNIAAAAAFGLGAIGAGFAISHVGAAAMGAVAEKPQIAGQALIFVALAEGIVVFGFITALMILGKL